MNALDGKVIQKSTTTLNRFFIITDNEPSFFDIFKVPKNSIDVSVNYSSWMVNIHPDDINHFFINWISFAKSIKTGNTYGTFIEKCRVIDKDKNETDYNFMYAVVETYNESDLFRFIKLFCYQIDKQSYETLNL